MTNLHNACWSARAVLFICTGNSTRSIMAEAILRGIGGDRFTVHSAGTFPAGLLQPLVVPTLLQLGMPTEGLRSKSWTEFAQPGAPVMDVVITLCDHAAAEPCPPWPGTPTRLHWSIADPTGDPMPIRPQAFLRTAADLRRRIDAFVRERSAPK